MADLRCATMGHEHLRAVAVGRYDDGDHVEDDVPYCAECARSLTESGWWRQTAPVADDLREQLARALEPSAWARRGIPADVAKALRDESRRQADAVMAVVSPALLAARKDARQQALRNAEDAVRDLRGVCECGGLGDEGCGGCTLDYVRHKLARLRAEGAT